MKAPISYFKTALPAFLFFLSARDGMAQDFKKGIPASSFLATPGYQSAALGWSAVSFAASGEITAGYLLIYSTSEPSLVSSPDGLSPDHAVMNGTIVPTAAAQLPALPLTSAQASGLADGTTYHFTIFAYTWDGISPSTYQYSAPLEICTTIPPDAPDGLGFPVGSATENSIYGSLEPPLFTPDGYLVAYSSSPVAPAILNGHFYHVGDIVGADTVAKTGKAVTFSTLQLGHALAPSTAYYIFAYSYVISACDSTPVYSSAYASDSISTLCKAQPVPVDAPAQSVRLGQDPVQGDALLRITSPVNDRLHMVLFSIDGTALLQKEIQVTAGSSTAYLSTSFLAKGMYFISAMFSNGNRTAIPFIKQ